MIFKVEMHLNQNKGLQIQEGEIPQPLNLQISMNIQNNKKG